MEALMSEEEKYIGMLNGCTLMFEIKKSLLRLINLTMLFLQISHGPS